VAESDMFPRGGKWYVWVRLTNPATGDRDRIPKSTGVSVGNQKDFKRAVIEGEKIALRMTLGTHHSTLTVHDAYKANRDSKIGARCAPATFEILEEKWPHIQHFFGDDHLLQQITDAKMVAYVARAAEGDLAKNIAPRSPGSITREIKELYRGMRILGLTPPKFPAVGKLGKGTRQLTRAQVTKLLTHLSPRWREHVIAYRLTGMRKAELYSIEARHVDVSTWMLTIPGAPSANGDDDRTIPVHTQLRSILEHRMKEHPRGPLFQEWTNADRDLRQAGNEAGIGPVSFNVLKASFGAEMLRAGVPTREVAEFYGHTSTRMVEEHYNRLQAGRHLEGALRKVKPLAIIEDEQEGNES
jgi:integrase